jgi:carbon-monoxide dehydrogenase large subunit
LAARKVRTRQKIAAYLLEVGEEDLEWEPGTLLVKGTPEKVNYTGTGVCSLYELPTLPEPGLKL